MREIFILCTLTCTDVQKNGGADAESLAIWAHESNQEQKVSPRGASD